jgi:hypothetical protein
MAFSRNWFRPAFAAAVGVVLALALGATNAFASCSYPSNGQTFSQWGDMSTYVPAPGGTFENGVAGWDLDNASLVDENESFFLNDSSDSKSLAIADGGSATSPAACVDRTYPTFRFMVRSTGSRLAVLKVDAIYRDLLDGGKIKLKTVGFTTAGRDWSPSLVQVLVLGQLAKAGDESYVQFRFTPVGVNASFQIDDIYIDPWARR